MEISALAYKRYIGGSTALRQEQEGEDRILANMVEIDPAELMQVVAEVGLIKEGRVRRQN